MSLLFIEQAKSESSARYCFSFKDQGIGAWKKKTTEDFHGNNEFRYGDSFYPEWHGDC